MKTTIELLTIIGITGLAVFSSTTCQAGEVQTKTNPKDGAEMVLVPAGPFKMGIDPIPMDQENRKQVNTPKHEVTLDAYWIYKYPVTVKQYKKFIADTNGKMPPEPLWGWKDDHPMVIVAWQDAVNYAKWAGAALPTECNGRRRRAAPTSAFILGATNGIPRFGAFRQDMGRSQDHGTGRLPSRQCESLWRHGHGRQHLAVVQRLVEG